MLSSFELSALPAAVNCRDLTVQVSAVRLQANDGLDTVTPGRTTGYYVRSC